MQPGELQRHIARASEVLDAHGLDEGFLGFTHDDIVPHVEDRVKSAVGTRRYVGLWPVRCLAMIRRWIWPVPSKMS